MDNPTECTVTFVAVESTGCIGCVASDFMTDTHDLCRKLGNCHGIIWVIEPKPAEAVYD